MKNRGRTDHFFEAIVKKNIESISKLLADGKDINERDSDGRTPLMHAVIEQSVPIVEFLIKKGANVNLEDSAGWSALHYAAQEDNEKIAGILLDNGSKVDAQDEYGNTALARAVFSYEGRGEMITLLLSRGANKLLKNKSNVSPLDLARSIANFDVIKFLE